MSQNMEKYGLMSPDGYCVHSNETKKRNINFYGNETPSLQVRIRFDEIQSEIIGRIRNMLPLLTSSFEHNQNHMLATPSVRSSLAQLSIDGQVLWNSIEFKKRTISVLFKLVAPNQPEILDHLNAFLTHKKWEKRIQPHPVNIGRIFVPGENSLLSGEEIEQKIAEQELYFAQLKNISAQGVVNQKANTTLYELPKTIPREVFQYFFTRKSGRSELGKIQTKKENKNGNVIPQKKCFVGDITINTGHNFGILETDFCDDAGRMCHQAPSHLDPGSTGKRQIEITPITDNIRQKNVRVHWRIHRASPHTKKRALYESPRNIDKE